MEIDAKVSVVLLSKVSHFVLYRYKGIICILGSLSKGKITIQDQQLKVWFKIFYQYHVNYGDYGSLTSFIIEV